MISFIIACIFVCVELKAIEIGVANEAFVGANGVSISKRDIMNAFCCRVNGTSDMA